MGDSRARQGKYKRNHFVPERRKYSKNNRNVSKVHKTSIQIWDNLRIKICDDNPGGVAWSVIFQSSGKDFKKVCVMKALDYSSLNKIGSMNLY